jgi:hypothetical protein
VWLIFLLGFCLVLWLVGLFGSVYLLGLLLLRLV